MSTPLQVQLVNAFLGHEEGIHSVILSEIFSSGGSKNLYIDKYGRAKKISGYVANNSSAHTTDTGASAARVTGLFPYKKTSGGSITRELIFVLDDGTNEWEIYKSTDLGATKALLQDLGSSPVGVLPDFAQFGDNLFITSGKASPKKYDGSSIAAAGEAQSPTPTAAAGSAGVLKGIYRYKLVARFNDDTRKAGSITDSVVLDSEQGSLSWTADADTDVVGYEVYRTFGNGFIFYYVDWVDGRTTAAYTDNTPDSDLLEARALEEHGDAPPTTYFCEPHKQRCWWGRSDTYPTRAWWSDPARPDGVYIENYLDFSDSDTQGDVLTGLVGNFENRLVAFTEKAVWTVGGTGVLIGDIYDWSRQRSNAQTGAVTHRAVVKVPKGARYINQTGEVETTSTATLAYFTPLGDIRLFDGVDDRVISHPIKDTLLAFNYAASSKIHVLHDSANSQFIWFYPSDSATQPDKAVCWNYRWGVWYKWETLPFASSCELDSSTDASVLLTGEASTATGAFIYTFFSGNDFNGSDIESVWMTKTLYGNDPDGISAVSHTKRWRWADFLFQPATGTTLTLEWLPGDAQDTASGVGTAFLVPDPELVFTSDGEELESSDNEQLGVSRATSQIKALLNNAGRYLHDTGIRLRIGDNAANGSWALEAFTLAYQTLEGMKRRVQ